MTCDPAPRADGRCVVCEKPRRIPSTPVTRKLRNAPRDPYAGDPFCSAVCARAYFGVKLSLLEAKTRSGVGARPPWKSELRS